MRFLFRFQLKPITLLWSFDAIFLLTGFASFFQFLNKQCKRGSRIWLSKTEGIQLVKIMKSNLLKMRRLWRFKTSSKIDWQIIYLSFLTLIPRIHISEILKSLDYFTLVFDPWVYNPYIFNPWDYNHYVFNH